jgi:hypothetical protein
LVDHTRGALKLREQLEIVLKRFPKPMPDQTQSPWGQYYKLWRVNIVVEKISNF